MLTTGYYAYFFLLVNVLCLQLDVSFFFTLHNIHSVYLLFVPRQSFLSLSLFFSSFQLLLSLLCFIFLSSGLNHWHFYHHLSACALSVLIAATMAAKQRLTLASMWAFEDIGVSSLTS